VKNKAKRVIIACNTSHIIIAKAYLAIRADSDQIDTTLLLADYNHAAEATYQQMDKLAHASPEFTQALWVNDFMTPSKLDTDSQSISNYINTIQKAVSKTCPEDVVEYCTWSIFNRYEQLLAEAFPSADIVLYEDGLALTSKRKVAEKCPNNKIPQTWIMTHSGISPHHIKRLSCVPQLLAKKHKLPHYLKPSLLLPIDKETYMHVVKEAIDCFSMKLPEDIHPDLDKILIVGTPIFDIVDTYTWENEFLLYKQVIEKVIHREGCVAYWKDHPFISKPFSQALKNSINSDRFIVIDTPQAAPIEYIATQVNFRRTISIGSSAQSILYELFGIPCAVIQQAGLEIVDTASESLSTFRQESLPYYL